MSYRALLKVLATMMASVGVLVAVAQAQEGDAKQVCPHKPGWTPTDEELVRLVETTAESVRNLCNAKLNGARLIGADLSRAKLNGADLNFANLSGANLIGADLTDADLSRAKLNGANLNLADLNDADLNFADLTDAYLIGANLIRANLTGAKLNGADLTGAKLNGADLTFANLVGAGLGNANLIRANLTGAKLNGADLRIAKLVGADLNFANLTGANLTGAKLERAILQRAELKDTQLAYANLAYAVYAPASPPPNAYVAGIEGLETVSFPRGEEIGLVQLRELLQEAGLREGERQATYAIESGKTKHALDDWRINRWNAVEGLFRLVAFDGTTAYGLRPGWALTLLVVLWALVIPFYGWSIWDKEWKSAGPAGIYRVWPKDGIEVHEGGPQRLYGGGLAALGWSVWFSLLSAFHIGFREFSVGTWLSRVHPHQFALEATGWVRTLSGLQSLISLYLLAMWVLTYFGRPFQ